MKRIVAVAAALALALSACEIRAEVTVAPDGSGTFGYVMAVEPFMLDGMPANENPFNDFQSALEDGPLPWTFTEFKEAGYRGVRASLPFTSIEDLRSKIGTMNEEGAGNGIDDTLTITQTADGGWTFRATTKPPEPEFDDGDLSPTWGHQQPTQPLPGQIVGDQYTPPLYPEQDTFDPGDYRAPNPLEAFEGAFRFEFHVTLPGKPKETNASETHAGRKSTTFVWRIEPSGSQAVDLVATTKPTPFPIVPVAAGLVLVGGAVWLVLRRRGSGGGAPPVVLESLVPVAAGGADILPGAPGPVVTPPDEELAG